MSTLGKYRLLHEIGRGASSVVHLAEDSLSGREVAVKVIEPSTGAQRAVYERLFFNEVRASGLLRHPNVVPVLDAGREGGRFYVVVEYVEGAQTLERHCAANALLPLARVLEIGIDCAEALHYAHGKGLIHRDVKPANVLLDARGQRARLTDFGVAVLGEAGAADTFPFAAAGSPLYMAPEQARADLLTPKVDVFALGIVLYQMLSGRHPFEGDSIAAVVRRLLYDDPESLARLRPDLPDGVARCVHGALARDPGARPASALALAEQLSELAGAGRRPLEGSLAEGRASRLARLDFFRDFAEPELWELLRWTDWREIASGSELVREGAHGDSFFVLVEGEVAVRKNGTEVARLAAGACFGEISFLSRHPRSATVVALGDVRVLQVNAALLANASERCQLEFQRVFIRTLVDRLVDTTDALARAR